MDLDRGRGEVEACSARRAVERGEGSASTDNLNNRNLGRFPRLGARHVTGRSRPSDRAHGQSRLCEC